MSSRAGGDRLEAGDHLQRRGLAAARRAHQHANSSVGDLEIELRDDDVSAVTFLNIDKGYFSHLLTFPSAVSCARSSFDGADEIAAGDPTIGQDEQDYDRDLRDDETRRREIEDRNVAIAVQFQHADRHRED